MICVNCFHSSTNVINSRPSKKLPTIWRRRQCSQCAHIFTTDEMPRFSDITVVAADNRRQEFNPGMLVVSIAHAFQHNPEAGLSAAWELTRTVFMKIFAKRTLVITHEHLAHITYETLRSFDEVAGMQYGLSHGVVTSLRRRGRPSFGTSPVSPSRETPQ